MPKIGKGPNYKYCEICRPNNFHIADSDHTSRLQEAWHFQIFNLITAVKETCLHVSKNPRAANLTRLQFLAIIITAVRHVLIIRNKTGL